MSTLAARLDAALKTAGVSVVGVSIGADEDKTTWRVSPASLQAAAQPIIDAFNPADPAHEAAEQDQAVAASLDSERIFSAIVWAVIDTYSAPATKAKYQAARTKIVNAYKARPWI